MGRGGGGVSSVHGAEDGFSPGFCSELRPWERRTTTELKVPRAGPRGDPTPPRPQETHSRGVTTHHASKSGVGGGGGGRWGARGRRAEKEEGGELVLVRSCMRTVSCGDPTAIPLPPGSRWAGPMLTLLGLRGVPLRPTPLCFSA